MEPFTGDTEESTEEITGRKNSKIKSLRTRLFRRSKKSGAEANPKLSQSASDVAIGKGLGSDEDLDNSPGMMGSRALSHDSIFLDDQTLTDSEPARVLSQENVHSKIKSLQTKLQLQKMHFGPPPLVLPVKSPEEPTSQSEEFLFFSSNDAPGEGTHTKTSPQPTSPPVSPVPKSTPTKPPPLNPFSPFPVPTSSSTATIEPPLDFSAPAEFTSSLNTSAARHRLSIKPRNQRASTKKKSTTVTQHGPNLNNLKPAENLEFVEEKEQQRVAQEREAEEEEKVHLTVKSPEVLAVTSKEAPKSSSQSSSHQDHETVAPQVLRVKPHRRVDSLTAKRPHSSFIESEIRENKEGLEAPALFDGKTKVPPEQLRSEFTSRVSSALGEGDNRRPLQRPPPGSGSFHFSISTVKNQDGERPRSGSFGGRLEQTEAKNKTVGGTEEEKKKEKEDFKNTQLKGSPFALERLRQEGSPSRGPASLWDRKTSLKKTETVTAAPNVPADPAAVQTEEMESSQEQVDDADEAKEEDGKTPFGVKLRSTSLSLKFRSDSSSHRHSKTELSEDQDPRKKNQETSNSTNRMPETPLTNTISSPRVKDPAPSGVTLSVKQSASPLENPPAVPTEAQTASSHNKAAETAPQTSSSEVSWMTLAMEKTRSLQQLFTSRFPKEFPGVQTPARPQAQAQPKPQSDAGTGTQAQTIKAQQSAHQPSADPVKEESESRTQEQVVKPSAVAKQQKIILKESQMFKQPNEGQPQSAQIAQRTTQSPLRSSSQTTSQLSQGSASQSLAQTYLSSAQQQPPSWPSRGFQPATQIKSTTPTQTSEMGVTSAPASDSASDKEGTVHKESPSLFSRRTIWTGSVAERAVFLEKRGEWTTPPSMTGVEMRKAQIEVQTSGDAPTTVKHPALNKDTMGEIRQVVKTAESSPIKVPEKPPEDKWLRKNMGSPSSPSSLHTRASELQSMSDSSQPSWMELAKRKSMAWSDKTMD